LSRHKNFQKGSRQRPPTAGAVATLDRSAEGDRVRVRRLDIYAPPPVADLVLEVSGEWSVNALRDALHEVVEGLHARACISDPRASKRGAWT
jgi:hypothetical protein